MGRSNFVIAGTLLLLPSGTIVEVREGLIVIAILSRRKT